MKCVWVLLCALGVAQAAPLRIVSLSTIGDELARKVGGSEVQVVGLVKPGIDPHDFEPSTGDLRKISQARLILAMGKGMEGYLTKLAETTRVPLLEIGAGLPSLQMKIEEAGHEGHGHAHTGEDPHWWGSIQQMKRAARVVRDAFTKLRPESKEVFAANTEKFIAELDALSQWAKKELAALPRDQRKLVTSHDAFQYFAQEWDFQVYPIEGITTKDEPSSQKVAGLIRTIQGLKVKAIFAESIENPKVLREITKETGAVLGGALYADGLGKGDASTYDGMVRHNITTLVKGLK